MQTSMKNLFFYVAISIGVLILISAVLSEFNPYQYMAGVYQIVVAFMLMDWEKETGQLEQEINLLKNILKEQQ